MQKNLIFRLKNGKRPVSWQLPIKNVLLPKDNGNGVLVDKLIHYVPGAPSIFVEDYKGESKAEDIVFEDGYLSVSPTDVLKIEILKKHRWFDVHYELVDDNATAEKELKHYELQKKAMLLVDESDETKLKATALALIGQEAFSLSAVICKARLSKMAMTEPLKIIKEIESELYESKYIAGLATLLGVIKTNNTNTAVVWGDSGNIIIRLAVGENAIDEMAKFLSVKSDESVITLQRIGELTNMNDSGAGNTKKPVDTTKDDLIKKQEAEIQILRKQLSEKQSGQAASSTEATTASGQTTSDGSQGGNDGANANTSDNDQKLAEVQKEYVELFEKDLPPNKKNDINWLSERIKEKKAQ